MSTLIHAALCAVMKDVGAVKKTDRNDTQHYSFRGVDAVVKAVYPALLQHGVTVQPNVRMYEYGSVEVGARRTPMGHARVIVDYTFTSTEDGSAVTCSAAGEAMDSGDKATPKAMSVALRTALLQALMLPTDDVEPDSQTYERSPAQEPADPAVAELNEAKAEVKAAWEASRGQFVMAEVEAAYDSDHDARLADASPAELLAFAQDLRAQLPNAEEVPA